MRLAKILIVEDERIIASDMERKLWRLGYEVCALVSSGKDAIEWVARCSPDLVLLDIGLQGNSDGIETARYLRNQWGRSVVFITAHTDRATRARAEKVNPLGYLVKPFTLEELRETVQTALGRLSEVAA